MAAGDQRIIACCPILSANGTMEHRETYVKGLLGDVTRKNVEQIALGPGENVRNL
jgi:hypothetical protein